MARGIAPVHPRYRRRDGSGGHFLHADDQSLAQDGKRLLQRAELRRMHGIEHAPDFLLVLLQPPAELDLRHAGLREGTEERELRRDFGLNRDGRELTALRPILRQGATFASVDQECEAERVSRHIQRLRPRRALRDRLRHIREAYDEARLVPGLDQRSISERVHHGSSLRPSALRILRAVFGSMSRLGMVVHLGPTHTRACPPFPLAFSTLKPSPRAFALSRSSARKRSLLSKRRSLPRMSDIFVRSSSICLSAGSSSPA